MLTNNCHLPPVKCTSATASTVSNTDDGRDLAPSLPASQAPKPNLPEVSQLLEIYPFTVLYGFLSLYVSFHRFSGECCLEVVNAMVMVVKKKMVVVMAVMVVAVVGGHFDPKIKIWNSCLSTMSSQHKPRSHTQHPVTGPSLGLRARTN